MQPDSIRATKVTNGADVDGEVKVKEVKEVICITKTISLKSGHRDWSPKFATGLNVMIGIGQKIYE